MAGIDISVIIPVYNLENFIRPMLESLAVQDLGEYTAEIIFVLNNCTDRSEDVIRKSGIDCRILKCKTKGAGPARNTGLEAAEGEYVWFMDGDDWLLSDTAIKQVMDKARCHGFNMIRIPFASNRFHANHYSMPWQYLFKREFIEEFRFPDYQPGEDAAFVEMALQKMRFSIRNYMRMPHMDKALYYYNYLREGSNMYRFLILKEKI